MPRSLAIVAIVLAVYGLVTVGCAQEAPPSVAERLDVGRTRALMADQDAAQASLQSRPEELAWKWFLMLNDPLVGSAPKMWESWKQTSAVYLRDGSKPLPWGQNRPLPEPVVAQARAQGLDMSKPFHNLDAEIQVDGLALRDVFRHNVRYQLLMNEDTFDYIVASEIYNVNGQERLAANDTPADFPWPSWELKTSWIWIGDDDGIREQLKDTYYIVNAYFRVASTGQYQVGEAALTGMHIINKLLPDWVWATFENIDNPKYTVTNGQPPAPMTNQLPISEAAKESNAIFREALNDEGSIFANYRLIGVQSAFVDDGGQATLLASSQIESAFQHSSSCITCHALASYSVGEGYFDIVESRDGGIVYYTGEPPREKLRGYTSLDFVWSLKRAYRER